MQIIANALEFLNQLKLTLALGCRCWRAITCRKVWPFTCRVKMVYSDWYVQQLLLSYLYCFWYCWIVLCYGYFRFNLAWVLHGKRPELACAVTLGYLSSYMTKQNNVFSIFSCKHCKHLLTPKIQFIIIPSMPMCYRFVIWVHHIQFLCYFSE